MGSSLSDANREGIIMENKVGNYWVLVDGGTHPRVAIWDGVFWWVAGFAGRFEKGAIEVISDRLKPPARFEIETIPG
jgi:hypothetical protein